MPALDLPRHHLRALQDLAARLLDSRKPATSSGAFARELLVGFFEVCMHAGLDRVLHDLAAAHPPLDTADATALADHPALHAGLVTALDAIDLDGGSPRAAKPRQVTDCVVAGLGLQVVDEPDRAITLDHRVRAEVAAALASAVEVPLAAAQLRETIIAEARAKCEPRHHGAFDKIAAQLDDRAMRMIKQPKVPLDAVQAVQRVLFETRNAVFARVSHVAIDRARDKLAAVSPEAAARIDQPVTLRLTPRDVAILRVCDARVHKVPAAILESLLGSLTELANLAWHAPERPIRPYAASQTFAVGDLIEHPKFGRGTVVSCMARRIDVEFADGPHTLVHVPSPK